MLQKGTILQDKYWILSTLGKRGMSGCTYLAETIGVTMPYAIKELDPKATTPEDYQEISNRFGAEAEYLQRLDGFNGQIPKFYGSFKELDSEGIERHYIVQEYIKGQTLTQYIEARGRVVSEFQVKEILSRLLPVIEHIHQKGFIHRDIKPDNIILRSTDNRPVLIDFGAVKDYELTLIREGTARTAFIGTRGYYDEDQWNGRPTIASDLYALGAVAVYLLTNTEPHTFSQKDKKMLWGNHVLDLSPDFFHFIDKAIEPRTSYPGQRFENAQDMLNALSQAVSKEELKEELTELTTRKPSSTSTNKFVSCRECKYYLNLEDENCINCGSYNIYRFDTDEIYLFDNSPEQYVKNIYLTANNKSKALLEINNSDHYLINNSIGNYIKLHTKFPANLPNYLSLDESNKLQSNNSRPFQITLGEHLQKYKDYVGNFGVTVWICSALIFGIAVPISIASETKEGGYACLSPCTAIIAVIIATWSRSLIWGALSSFTERLLSEKTKLSEQLEHLQNRIRGKKDRLQKELFHKSTDRKEQLKEKFDLESASYRKNEFYLSRAGASINKQLELINVSTTRLKKISDLLERDIKDTPSDFSTEDYKRDQERTLTSLQILSQQDLKYKVKLQEIELLRLNNIIQAETPRQRVSQNNRSKAKEKIDQMAKLSEKIFNDLKKANVATAGSEQLWLKRISLIREILMKLRNSLTSHIVDLAHKEFDNQAVDFPLEITSGLDRLAAYITNEDFDKEHRMLQAKYGGNRFNS